MYNPWCSFSSGNLPAASQGAQNERQNLKQPPKPSVIWSLTSSPTCSLKWSHTGRPHCSSGNDMFPPQDLWTSPSLAWNSLLPDFGWLISLPPLFKYQLLGEAPYLIIASSHSQHSLPPIPYPISSPNPQCNTHGHLLIQVLRNINDTFYTWKKKCICFVYSCFTSSMECSAYTRSS